MAELFDFKAYNNDCYKIPNFGPLLVLAFFSFLPLSPLPLMFYQHTIINKWFPITQLIHDILYSNKKYSLVFMNNAKNRKRLIQEEAQMPTVHLLVLNDEPQISIKHNML